MDETEDADRHEQLTTARALAQQMLDDRRRTAWRTFAAASLVLLAVTLGTLVFFGRPGARFAFWPYGFIAVVGLGLFSAAACLWIDQNQNLAAEARTLIREHNRRLGVPTDPEVELAVGYVKMVMALTAVAILAIAVTVDY